MLGLVREVARAEKSGNDSKQVSARAQRVIRRPKGASRPIRALSLLDQGTILEVAPGFDEGDAVA